MEILVFLVIIFAFSLVASVVLGRGISLVSADNQGRDWLDGATDLLDGRKRQ